MAGIFPLVGAFLSLTTICIASNPIHIHLSYDGNKDPRYSKIKFTGKNNIKAKDLSKTELEDIKNKIDEGKDYRLYISDFATTENHKELKWGSKMENEKYLAGIVKKLFKPEAIVIVVFPYNTQLLSGFSFLKEFENEVHISHPEISIGRERIHLYYYLDEKQDKSIQAKHPKSNNDYDKSDCLISIAANSNGNYFNCASQKWSKGVPQVLIHEADTVIIKLVCTCKVDKDDLKVGGQTHQSLAEQLKNMLRATDKSQIHPERIIRVKLPRECGDEKTRTAFTKELIKKLREHTFDAYGEEPRVVLYIAKNQYEGDNFPVQALKMMDLTEEPHQYLATLDNNGKITLTDSEQFGVKVSKMKELSIAFFCHGNFVHDADSVCGQSAEDLAQKVKQIVSEASNTQIVFYACNAGTEKGLKYIGNFLENVSGLKVTEVIAFKTWTTDEAGTQMVIVPNQDELLATTIIDKGEISEKAWQLLDEIDGKEVTLMPECCTQKDENYAFGRFISKWNPRRKTYASLPKTEFVLMYG